MKAISIAATAFAVFAVACVSRPSSNVGPMSQTVQDPYLHLEEIDSESSMTKVKAWNERSLSELQAHPLYAGIESDTRKILLAEDRVPQGPIRGGWVYNFWQDKKHVRGIWRRTKVSEYAKAAPKWDVLLDLDQLSAKENENWVWKGAECRPPLFENCLVWLSRGGKDASILREFSVSRKTFVEGGFELPEAKSNADWFDDDTIWVGTDFGPGTLTKSGYPRQVRLWKRGEPLEKSQLVFEAQESDISAMGFTSMTPEGNRHFVYRGVDFFRSEISSYHEGRLEKLALPTKFKFRFVRDGRLLGITNEDWKVADRSFKSGSLVAFPMDGKSAPELVFEPGPRAMIAQVARTRNANLAIINENALSRIVTFERKKGGAWKLEDVKLPGTGQMSLYPIDVFDDRFIASLETFLDPVTLYLFERSKAQEGSFDVGKLKALPRRFEKKGMSAEQYEAKSKDGTLVPYFVVHKKGGSKTAPTLLYGYGGFNNSLFPWYLGNAGKSWLEKGGTYVVANIRGGGEFGPKWHQAALKENRQRAFDDFIAIAEDLIRREITTPRQLAIQGGSNGGLLVGAVFTQRPELFKAVICQVPLLDMLRYHKLLAGASWVGEYGDPEDPKMAEIIGKYSPYQNLSKSAKYPRVLFMTSTRDDRVHPGHARKMAARMEELGHPFLYYENTEGGHSAAANIEQRIKMQSLQWTYLWNELGGVEQP